MSGERIIRVENLSAFLVFSWGAVAFNPYSDLFPKNPQLFGTMASLISSETVWGLFFMACGITALALAYKGHPMWTARINVVLFTSFAILYAIGDISQPGFWFFGAIATANFVIQGATKWKTLP